MKIERHDLYRPAEVAALTGISVSSVYRLVNSGDLKHFLIEKEGGGVRIPGLAVEELLARELDNAVTERVRA